jgi:hypothetical protein
VPGNECVKESIVKLMFVNLGGRRGWVRGEKAEIKERFFLLSKT